MKVVNLVKPITVLFFVMILSTSLFAQEKPAKETKPDACCAHDAKEAKVEKAAKHKCTKECAKIGCATVKAKATKCGDKECKTKSCESKKCETTETAKYECPMKCEPASDKKGECSKCGMDLKKV